MLCKDKITSIFCIIDDILKEIKHSEDIRRKISDSEIITTGEGIPIAFHFTVGKTADVKALDKITEIFLPIIFVNTNIRMTSRVIG